MQKMFKGVLKVLMGFLVISLFTGCGFMRIIDSGQVGVQINSGKVQDETITEGFNFSINPMAELVTYNVKAKQLEMTDGSKQDTNEIIYDSAVTILTKDNLQIPVDITVLYKLKDSCAPHIRKEFGEDVIWDNKVVVPVTRDVVRGTIGKDADVYKLNQNREQYASEIKNNLESKINEAIRKECVSIEMVSIRDIKLPPELMASIMIKNQMEEQTKTAELSIKRAEAEAKVEVTKKEGIAKAQMALAKSITPELIRWKQMEIEESAVHKWDGKLPSTNLGSATPFINVGK